MNKLFTLTVYCLLFTANLALAQNGVRIAATTGVANASAMLDVESTSKGFLLPRVTLVALTNGTSPINAPAPGLLVYHLGSVGIPAVGVYYWDGSASAWVQLTAGGMSGSGTTNYVTKWTAANVLGNSQIFDNGTNVGVGMTTTAISKLHSGGTITIGTGVTAQAIGNIQLTTGGASPISNRLTYGTDGTGWKFAIGKNQGGTVTDQVIISDNGTVQIPNLAGTGFRQVYASSTGVLQTVPSISTAVQFAYTGVDQTFTVPAGVFFIQVDLFGAAGGNGSWGGWQYGWSGGPGGYTHGTIAVTPGQVLTVIVGQGGAGGATSNAVFSYGGGGRNCNGADCQYAAKGGGRSAIRSGATELLTAGGGGGGGSVTGIGVSYRMNGGAGGGLLGGNSINEYSGQVATGGTQTTGGTGMPGNVRNGTNGSQFTGGTQGGTESYGGGGGGGWYGGGGGNYYSNAMGGGAGGSGYISGPGVTNAWTQTGGGAQPEGGSAGIGTSNWPYFGRNGVVIISY